MNQDVQRGPTALMAGLYSRKGLYTLGPMIAGEEVQESMRMYSTAPMALRVAKKDVQLGPYLVPAGTYLCLHIYAMHNISHNWERHDEFLPVRAVPSRGRLRLVC